MVGGAIQGLVAILDIPVCLDLLEDPPLMDLRALKALMGYQDARVHLVTWDRRERKVSRVFPGFLVETGRLEAGDQRVTVAARGGGVWRAWSVTPDCRDPLETKADEGRPETRVLRVTRVAKESPVGTATSESRETSDHRGDWGDLAGEGFLDCRASKASWGTLVRLE